MRPKILVTDGRKDGWLLVVLRFNATLTAKVISWQSVFPGFLTPELTQLFFPKPSTTFLTCFCRGERNKYARKKVCLNQGLNSQTPRQESDMLTTEPPGCTERHTDRVKTVYPLFCKAGELKYFDSYKYNAFFFMGSL